MPRDARAYLADVIESCDAIASALHGMDVAGYQADRLIRSSVEPEFIIIGEAMVSLSRNSPELLRRITQARRIVDFRNQLTHEYRNINDVLVWGIADRDVPVLREKCMTLMAELGESAV